MGFPGDIRIYLFTPALWMAGCQSSGQPVEEVYPETEEIAYPTDADACAICMLQEDLTEIDINWAMSVSQPDPSKYQDSLDALRIQIEDTLYNMLDRFRIELDLPTNGDAQVEARQRCVNSFTWGTFLDTNEKDSIFTLLYNELYMSESGFRISEKEYLLSTMRPRGNETQEEFDAWKAEKLKAWEAWYAEVDRAVIKVVGKPYAQMSRVEKWALERKLVDHSHQ